MVASGNVRVPWLVNSDRAVVTPSGIDVGVTFENTVVMAISGAVVIRVISEVNVVMAVFEVATVVAILSEIRHSFHNSCKIYRSFVKKIFETINLTEICVIKRLLNR